MVRQPKVIFPVAFAVTTLLALATFLAVIATAPANRVSAEGDTINSRKISLSDGIILKVPRIIRKEEQDGVVLARFRVSFKNKNEEKHSILVVTPGHSYESVDVEPDATLKHKQYTEWSSDDESETFRIDFHVSRYTGRTPTETSSTGSYSVGFSKEDGRFVSLESWYDD